MDNDKLIQKRKSELDNFVKESFPANIDFADRLGLSNPHEILMNFDELKDFIFLTVHDFMKFQTVNPENRIWIITRLGYLLGEYFKEKYSGYWTVNENEGSPQFGRYVIFVLSSSKTTYYPIDIFEAVAELVDQKGERNLIQLIHEIEEVIQ